MVTGIRGTFVISWSQTEIDGVTTAPLDVLAVGASWRWSGQAVRVDGQGGMLLLEGAEGIADIRRRAAKMVRRLIGVAVTGGPIATEDGATEQEDTPDQGFIVTDGHQSWSVTILPVPDTGARLLMFVGEVPPPGQDLWVVRTAIDRTHSGAGAKVAGGVICFTPGTRIATPTGARMIQEMRPGDRILTKDNGAQEILWTGSRRMTGARLYAMPHLRPIRFKAGAMGIDRPDEDLIVSPQHRIVLNGPAARALFNTEEVLVKAEDLLNDATICIDHALREVIYIHILLDRHNIIWANGMETESFHPSNTALDTIEPAQRSALLALLPDIETNPVRYGDYARRNLSTSEVAILRHDTAA
ncbi:MAG: Hint domain-containing protein [Paracoccaceae bacterium]